jgi:hypothetical protein
MAERKSRGNDQPITTDVQHQLNSTPPREYPSWGLSGRPSHKKQISHLFHTAIRQRQTAQPSAAEGEYANIKPSEPPPQAIRTNGTKQPKMSVTTSTPVVIGVGDFINRSKKVEDAVEPLQLMLSAIDGAVKDAGLSESSSSLLRAAVDSLDVVRTWTWPYPDLPGLIAERLGIDPARKHYTDHGGNQPGLLFDEAARRISKGETKVAILTGGEALASCMFFAPVQAYPLIARPSNPQQLT